MSEKIPGHNPPDVVEKTRAAERWFQVKTETAAEAIKAVARAIPQGDLHPFSDPLDAFKACCPVSAGNREPGVWDIIVEYKR